MKPDFSLIDAQMPSIQKRIALKEDLGFFIDGHWHPVNRPLNFQSFDDELPVRLKRLMKALTLACYHLIFCGLTARQVDEPLPPLAERQEFMTGLSEMNRASRKPDVNWQITKTDAFGLSHAIKDGVKRPLLPGTYVAHKKRAGWVNFIRTGEYRGQDPFFYHALSDAYFQQNEEQVCFYWNMAPEGISKLLEELTQVLNHYRIPYEFRCLNHPKLYTRVTTALLFIHRFHYHLVGQVSDSVNMKLADFFREDTPPFTTPLSTGFSMSPVPMHGPVYGKFMMRQVAQKLVYRQCFNSKLESSELVPHFQKVLQYDHHSNG